MPATAKKQLIGSDDIIELVHEQHGRNWEMTLKVISNALGKVIADRISDDSREAGPYTQADVEKAIDEHLQHTRSIVHEEIDMPTDYYEQQPNAVA